MADPINPTRAVDAPDYDGDEDTVLSDDAWEAWERALREAKAAYESEKR